MMTDKFPHGLTVLDGGPPPLKTPQKRRPFSKVSTANEIRRQLSWLYNEYKRGMLLPEKAADGSAFRSLTPDDVRALVMVLGKLNDVRKDSVTEGTLKEMQDTLKRLEEKGTALTPETVTALMNKPAFQMEEAREPSAIEEGEDEEESRNEEEDE